MKAHIFLSLNVQRTFECFLILREGLKRHPFFASLDKVTIYTLNWAKKDTAENLTLVVAP